MNLNSDQLDTISKYFSDISKVVFASIVIGYFIQPESMSISGIMFALGVIGTLLTLFISIIIKKQK